MNKQEDTDQCETTLETILSQKQFMEYLKADEQTVQDQRKQTPFIYQLNEESTAAENKEQSKTTIT